ncbi:MAG: FHA domain-containing protein [Gallionellaceae bacterium]|nr:MAG: FHA domain-containing protein [Gallionellaceae bacterium]
MPAKLILSMDGVVLKEYVLNKERTTIGRKPHNDIVIDNLAISSEHAAIITILNDSFLEDLDSTNGLSVNGAVTKKHFLQNNDLIEIGKYKLKYLNDQPAQAASADFEKTMVLSRPVKTSPAPATAEGGEFMRTQVNAAPYAASGDTTGKFVSPTAPKSADEQPAVAPAQAAPVTAPQPNAPAQQAAVQILNGPNAGKELELVKSLTTLGKPGVQVAVLARRPHGFFITHVEGAKFPLVNGESVGEHPRQLNDHDIIELAGVKMEFYFKA